MILGHMGTLDSKRGRGHVPCHSVSREEDKLVSRTKRLVRQPLSIASQVQTSWQIPRLGMLNLGPLIASVSWLDGRSGVCVDQIDNPSFRFCIVGIWACLAGGPGLEVLIQPNGPSAGI